MSENIYYTNNSKNVLVAFLLTFFFGPLGMLYTTIKGGLIMLVVSLIVGLLTLGYGCIITQIICLIWTVNAANNFNKKSYSASILNEN